MPHRPSAREVAEQDRFLLLRQESFRAAADAVTATFATFAEVQRVALFGSVARPLAREVPRFQPYRRLGIELLHECKDVDLAVWLTDMAGLSDLGRARNQAVSEVGSTAGPGVAHHQVDVFLLDFATDEYLGRLRWFASCPKGKPECRVPRCGETQLLRHHEDFIFADDALTDAVILFDRQSGSKSLATQLPSGAGSRRRRS
jgi:hypothetical protein